MTVHPLWRPYERPTQHETDQAFVSGSEPPTPGRIEVVPYDAAWPATYERVAASVREALHGRVLDLQHVGSTAVPGLPAKPVIDVDLVVADELPLDQDFPERSRGRGGLLADRRHRALGQQRVDRMDQPFVGELHRSALGS